MIAALSELGLPAGAKVAVAHPDIHPRLLVMLALEHLGLTAMAFRADEGELAEPVLAAADLVMSWADMAHHRPRRWLQMTDAWLASVLARPPGRPARPVMNAQDGLLLARSSGSTGRPKPMMVTRGVLSARLAQRVVSRDFHRHDRFLAVMHFTVANVLYSCLLCLRLGATVMSYHRWSLPEALSRMHPTHLYMLPFQLAQLLREEDALTRMPEIKVVVGGGHLTPSLRLRALERLCGKIIQNYGANETSGICTLDEDGLGTLAPGVSVKIAAEDGGPLPPEAVGEICVRGPSVVSGYYDDPSATAARWRDGWWHSGDFGCLMRDGRLKLLGRQDDVLNFGGIKRSAADLEAEMAARGVTEELAVLAAPNDDGGALVVVCVATNDDSAAAGLAFRIRDWFGGRFALYRIDRIPRTSAGKVDRASLRETIAARQPVEPANVSAPVEPVRRSA